MKRAALQQKGRTSHVLVKRWTFLRSRRASGSPCALASVSSGRRRILMRTTVSIAPTALTGAMPKAMVCGGGGTVTTG